MLGRLGQARVDDEELVEHGVLEILGALGQRLLDLGFKVADAHLVFAREQTLLIEFVGLFGEHGLEVGRFARDFVDGAFAVRELGLGHLELGLGLAHVVERGGLGLLHRQLRFPQGVLALLELV